MEIDGKDKKRSAEGSLAKYERPKKIESQRQVNLPTPPVLARGRTFLGGIDALTKGNSPSVFTKLDVPYLDSSGKAQKVDRYGTFSTRDWASEKRTTWTQGLYSGNPGSTYTTAYYGDNKSKYALVPKDLSLRRATVESQTMKFLSDDAYTVKDEKRVQAGSPSEKTEHWGGLTMGSFLEDITGSRALGIHGVGSALRAKTMAAKWEMKSENDPSKTSVKDFGGDALEKFPQLGKAEWRQGYGASELREKLDHLNDPDDNSKRQQARKIVEDHLGIGGSIPNAHADARKQAKRRFDSKFKEFEKDGDAKALGGWWEGKAAELTVAKEVDHFDVRLQLRDEYVGRKMERHGIGNYAGPRRIAKENFKYEARTKGLDKTSDRPTYKEEKRKYVDKALRDAGLGAKADKAKATWALKDRFAAKLGEIGKGNMPTGKWWQAKAKTTDLTALKPEDHKQLQREYVAYRNMKKK